MWVCDPKNPNIYEGTRSTWTIVQLGIYDWHNSKYTDETGSLMCHFGPANSLEHNPNVTSTNTACEYQKKMITISTTYHDAMDGSHVSTNLYVSFVSV